jgi:hypothetical protein
MGEDSAREYPSFVVRLWLEPGPRDQPRWRGRVKHVQGDREAYFESLRELSRFLADISGVAVTGDEPDDDDRSRP